MSERILIVDQNVKNIQVAASTLRSVGYNIAYASSSEKAIEKTNKIKFSLILLDVGLTGTDGFEVLEEIRKEELNKSTSILFIVEKKTQSSIPRIYELGEAGYIRKPFETNELLAKVSQQISFDNSEQTMQKLKKSQRQLTLLLTQTRENAETLLAKFGTDWTIVENGMQVNQAQSQVKTRQALVCLHMLNMSALLSTDTRFVETTTHIGKLMRSTNLLISDFDKQQLIQIKSDFCEMSISSPSDVWQALFCNLSFVFLHYADATSKLVIQQDIIQKRFIFHVNLPINLYALLHETYNFNAFPNYPLESQTDTFEAIAFIQVLLASLGAHWEQTDPNILFCSFN